MNVESWHRWISDITVDIPAGPTILEAIQEMVRISSFSNARVHAKINDIDVCVTPGEMPLVILDRYENAKKCPYRRLVLYADKDIEIVLIFWPVGSRSLAHDHGKSHGATMVIKGSVFERTFDRKTKQFLTSGIHPANITEVFEESPRYIHIVGNAGPNEAMTLHVYTPPLKMNVYPNLA